MFNKNTFLLATCYWRCWHVSVA